MSLDFELYTSRNVTLADLRAIVPHVEAWRAYGGDALAYEAPIGN
jgi:hypothetical protein